MSERRLAVVPSDSSQAAIQLPLLITVKEAARLLSVDESTVRRLSRTGELRYKKLSERKWLIAMKSVRDFAQKLVAA